MGQFFLTRHQAPTVLVFQSRVFKWTLKEMDGWGVRVWTPWPALHIPTALNILQSVSSGYLNTLQHKHIPSCSLIWKYVKTINKVYHITHITLVLKRFLGCCFSPSPNIHWSDVWAQWRSDFSHLAPSPDQFPEIPAGFWLVRIIQYWPLIGQNLDLI